MAEVLRLQIIYETQAAAAQVQALVDRMNKLEGVTAKTQRAAAGFHGGLKKVEGGLRALSLAALGVPGPLGSIASGLLLLGPGSTAVLGAAAGIGLMVGLAKALATEAEEANRQAEKLQKTLANLGPTGAVKAAQIKLSPLQLEERKISDQIAAFTLLPAAQQVFEHSKLEVLLRKQAEIQSKIADITNNELIPAEKAATEEQNKRAEALKRQTEELERQKKLLEEQAKVAFLLAGELDVITHRFIVDMARHGDSVNAFDRMRLGGNLPGPRPLDLGFGQRPDSPLRSLDTNFQGAARGLGPMPEELLVNRLTDQQQRLVDSWTDGMHTMQDAMEDFLVTGKLSIQALADEFLRIAFRASTDQFVDKAVKFIERKFAK